MKEMPLDASLRVLKKHTKIFHKQIWEEDGFTKEDHKLFQECQRRYRNIGTAAENDATLAKEIEEWSASKIGALDKTQEVSTCFHVVMHKVLTEPSVC